MTMLNKSARAKLAKDTINNTIPKILNSNHQARTAVNNSELVHYSPTQDKRLVQSDGLITKSTNLPVTFKSTTASASKDIVEVDELSLATVPLYESANGDTQTGAGIAEASKSSAPLPLSTRPKIRIIKSDTFDAAQTLLSALPPHSKSRIGVLNMASALRPGGGVLHGALAQEESLCMRSTLYASLHEPFYRIPEDAAIYSPDVLVFRSSLLSDLPKASWFFVDVISCPALRDPDVSREGEYEFEKDREIMTMRVRLILQVAREKGVKRLVLGALGCGAYRNPPAEVAKIFKKVIFGGRRRKGVEGFEEIVFAIFDEGENLRVFREVFTDVIEE